MSKQSKSSTKTVAKKSVKKDVDSTPKPRTKKSGSEAPKRGRTAYIFFTQDEDVRSEIKEENPGSDFKDMSKLIAARWKGMSDKEKAPYQKLAEEDKERAELEKKEWLKNGGGKKKGTCEFPMKNGKGSTVYCGKKNKAKTNFCDAHYKALEEKGSDDEDEEETKTTAKGSQKGKNAAPKKAAPKKAAPKKGKKDSDEDEESDDEDKKAPVGKKTPAKGGKKVVAKDAEDDDDEESGTKKKVAKSQKGKTTPAKPKQKAVAKKGSAKKAKDSEDEDDDESEKSESGEDKDDDEEDGMSDDMSDE